MQMGEAAPCFMRSVSQPLFASCGFNEGDRLRALTTSVSFGRFMTEPLDWEKWSSFSHNRTLEDVQKYSRPGAVAEKKAFFEAYYRNFAAKKGAKSPKKENKPPKCSDIDENKASNRSREPETSSNEDICLPSTSNLSFSERGNVDDIISSTCQAEQEKTSTESVSSPSTNLFLSNGEAKVDIASNKDVCLPSINLVYSETGNVDGTSSNTSQVEDVKPSTDLAFSQFMDVKNDASNNRGVELEVSSKGDAGLPRSNLVFSENGNVDGIISSASQVEPCTDLTFSQFMDVKDDSSNNRVVEPEISSKENAGLPRADLVIAKNGDVNDTITSSGQMEQDKTSTEKVSSEQHRCQVEISNHVEKNKKRQIKDKVSVQTKTKITGVKSSYGKAPITEIQHKKVARDLLEKTKSDLQSVYSSAKYPASLNKNLNLKALSKAKDRPVHQALTRVGDSTSSKQDIQHKKAAIDLSKPKDRPIQQATRVSSVNFQVLPRPENQRSKPLLNSPLNGSKTTVLKSFPTNHSEASTASAKKPRSTTVFSSFSFRSDERAARRKEFFQKLEERGNTNKPEKTQLQTKLKEKDRSDNRKIPWSTVLQAKKSASERQGPSNIIQKVPPKLGKKNYIEINKKNLSRSMTCMPSKKLRDSALMLKK